MKFKPLAFGLLAAVLISCSGNEQQVDTIVINAKVYTVDQEFSVQEAFAVKDGKFVAVGDTKSILDAYRATDTIDAQGSPVYPGFYDPHAHFYGYAKTLMQADLMGSTSFDDILDRLKTFRGEFPNAAWLIGRGWDQNLWPVKEFPTKEQIDAVFPDIPVYLVRIDGHAAVVNSKALEIAGILGSRDIEGGSIEIRNGKPTGILVDNAMGLIQKHIPEPTQDEMVVLLKKAEVLCVEAGLTTVSDAGLDRAEIEFLQGLYEKGELQIRNNAMIHIYGQNLDHFLSLGPIVTDKFTAHTFKILADGALGSRGACLLEPYSDAPDTRGFFLYSHDEINQALAKIVNSPFQVSTHAIGDSTNRFMLDQYGHYLKGKNERRWRIEHAQIIAPGDMEKFGKFDILPSVQATHATSDMFWAADRLGADRMKGAYAFKSLLDQVGVLPLGSDFPVEHIQPLYGFHAAVARVNAEGLPTGGFQMDQAITREQALKGMTVWAAYSVFEEEKRGSIEAGKAADFVILAKDIMVIPNEELRDVQTVRTVIAGETVFARP